MLRRATHIGMPQPAPIVWLPRSTLGWAPFYAQSRRGGDTPNTTKKRKEAKKGTRVEVSERFAPAQLRLPSSLLPFPDLCVVRVVRLSFFSLLATVCFLLVTVGEWRRNSGRMGVSLRTRTLTNKRSQKGHGQGKRKRPPHPFLSV